MVTLLGRRARTGKQILLNSSGECNRLTAELCFALFLSSMLYAPAPVELPEGGGLSDEG